MLEQSRDAAREQSKGDKKRKKQAAQDAASAPAPAAVEAPKSAPDRKATAAVRQQRNEEQKPLRKELGSVDKRLAALTGDRESCEVQMAAATATPAERAEQGKRLKQISDEIDKLEARWLELSTQLDALSATAH